MFSTISTTLVNSAAMPIKTNAGFDRDKRRSFKTGAILSALVRNKNALTIGIKAVMFNNNRIEAFTTDL